LNFWFKNTPSGNPDLEKGFRGDSFAAIFALKVASTGKKDFKTIN
jgi:hypothetical protein